MYCTDMSNCLNHLSHRTGYALHCTEKCVCGLTGLSALTCVMSGRLSISKRKVFKVNGKKITRNN